MPVICATRTAQSTQAKKRRRRISLPPPSDGGSDRPKAEAEESYLAGLPDGRTTVEEEKEGACEHTWERPLGTGGGHATRFALRVICAMLLRERKGERPPSAICSLEAA